MWRGLVSVNHSFCSSLWMRSLNGYPKRRRKGAYWWGERSMTYMEQCPQYLSLVCSQYNMFEPIIPVCLSCLLSALVCSCVLSFPGFDVSVTDDLLAGPKRRIRTLLVLTLPETSALAWAHCCLCLPSTVAAPRAAGSVWAGEFLALISLF